MRSIKEEILDDLAFNYLLYSKYTDMDKLTKKLL